MHTINQRHAGHHGSEVIYQRLSTFNRYSNGVAFTALKRARFAECQPICGTCCVLLRGCINKPNRMEIRFNLFCCVVRLASEGKRCTGPAAVHSQAAASARARNRHTTRNSSFVRPIPVSDLRSQQIQISAEQWPLYR